MRGISLTGFTKSFRLLFERKDRDHQQLQHVRSQGQRRPRWMVLYVPYGAGRRMWAAHPFPRRYLRARLQWLQLPRGRVLWGVHTGHPSKASIMSTDMEAVRNALEAMDKFRNGTAEQKAAWNEIVLAILDATISEDSKHPVRLAPASIEGMDDMAESMGFLPRIAGRA